MKKILFLSVLILFIVSVSVGQMAYKMGDQVASLTIGLGYAGVYGSSTLPPIAVAYEYGYNENISFGGIVGIAGSSYEYAGYSLSGTFPNYTYTPSTWKWSYTYILIGARGAYHADLLHDPNVDTYGGLLLGYNIVSSSVSGVGTTNAYSAGGSYLAFGVFIGGRYYFSPNFAAQLELGYGLGYINVGVAYKL